MTTYITLADLQVFRPDIDPARADALIKSAEAQALTAAPDIGLEAFVTDSNKMEVLKGILRGAILRWDDLLNTGQSLTARSETAGPFSHNETVDTRQPGGVSLWPSELDKIRNLVGGNTGKAFAINTNPGVYDSPHSPICALNFGANYCSCGAILTNLLYPLYEAVDF